MNNRHKVMTKKLEDISNQLLGSEGADPEAIEEELTATLNSIVGSDVSEEVEEYYKFEEEKQWSIFAETDELKLCKPREGDVDNYIKLQKDTTLMPSVFKMPGYEDFLKEDFYDEKVFMVIIRQKADDAFVGYCSIKNIKHERWELAIEILKKYQHRGYGRQALAAFMDKVRDCTGVCDFIARVDPENTVSQSMCEALAWVPEKITEHLLHDQEYMEQYEKENAHEVTDEMRRLAMKYNVAYWDYVVGVIVYAKKKPERMKIVTEYVKSHMDETTSDIVWFISNQPDFHDDAAPCYYEDDEDV